LSYDPVGDFAPVTLLITQPNMMCVPLSKPAKSVQEFIAYCNDNRGKVTYASSGNGTTLHLSGELFKRLAKVEMTHIPIAAARSRSTTFCPAASNVSFDNMPSIIAHVRAGAVRALAVTTKERVPWWPRYSDHRGIGRPRLRRVELVRLLPAGRRRREIIAKLNADTNAALAHPSVKPPLRRPRRHPMGTHARSARRLPEIGNREMGPGDQGGQDQGGELRGTT